jgi:hypothetical protein
MKTSGKVILVVAAVAIVLAFWGCSPSNSTNSGTTGIFSSPYSVDCKIVNSPLNRVADNLEIVHIKVLDTTVIGPAAKLALVLTGPNGKTTVDIIKKDMMMANSYNIKLMMEDQVAGKWTLVVKTVDPEKVVCQKEVMLSPTQVAESLTQDRTAQNGAPVPRQIVRR